MASSASSEDVQSAPSGEEDQGQEFPDQAKMLEEANKLVLSLQAAAKEDDVKKIKECIAKAPPGLLINTRDKEGGLTALHIATRAGNDKAVECLLNNGASLLIMDKSGFTAMDYARVRNRQSCLTLLKTHIKTQPPALKEIGPLIASLFEAPLDRELMSWALEYYGPTLLDAKGRDMCCPLHFAITNNDPNLVEQLLAQGADPFVKDAQSRSPLDMAQLTGNPAMIKAVSRVMRIQLMAFVGLAVLFLVYRKGGDPHQAWFLLGVVYPAFKTYQALQLATKHAMGEWLTYWALLAPILILEKAFASIPPHLVQQIFPPPSPPGSDGSPQPHGLTNSLLDLYIIFKMVSTLYLVYPACRGARNAYQRFVDPEERARIQARQKRAADAKAAAKKRDTLITNTTAAAARGGGGGGGGGGSNSGTSSSSKKDD